MMISNKSNANQNIKENMLIDAVSDIDLAKVIELLEDGADVNYRMPTEVYIDCASYKCQPYSALRVVVFRISDSALEYTNPKLENPMAEFQKIAHILLDYGADADDAYELIVDRYGYPRDEWDDDDMCAVLNLIARKRTHQDSLEEQLVAAIYTINLEKVIAILANGADAGHRIPLERSRMDGTVCFPLRIVVFCLLDYYQDPTAEQQHEYLCAQLVKIANLLLMHGADAYDAYQFAIEHYSDYRYGDIWTDKHIMSVLDLIAQHGGVAVQNLAEKR